MGTYVYALNTDVRTISGETVGVAEYRYKLSWSLSGQREEEMLHKRLCGRRISFFDNHPDQLPALMTHSDGDKPNTLVDGNAVFLSLGPCFSDDVTFTKVGVLKKTSNRWSIELLPEAQEKIALHKAKQAERQARALETY